MDQRTVNNHANIDQKIESDLKEMRIYILDNKDKIRKQRLGNGLSNN